MPGPRAVGFVSAGSRGVRRGEEDWLRLGVETRRLGSFFREVGEVRDREEGGWDVIGFVSSNTLGSGLGSFRRPRRSVAGLVFPSGVAIGGDNDWRPKHD